MSDPEQRRLWDEHFRGLEKWARGSTWQVTLMELWSFDHICMLEASSLPVYPPDVRAKVSEPDRGLADYLHNLRTGSRRDVASEPERRSAQMATPAERRLVYGQLNDYELVFIPEHQACELATVQDATTRAATWGEFRSLLPNRRWLQVVETYESADEPVPGDEEPFDADEVPGYADGDCPEWPAQEMLDWMPVGIQERFGEVGSSMVSGDSLLIDPAVERDVVAALEQAGYVCIRNDDLVEQASGY